jgi:hypothetical protein
MLPSASVAANLSGVVDFGSEGWWFEPKSTQKIEHRASIKERHLM